MHDLSQELQFQNVNVKYLNVFTQMSNMPNAP